jgi:hypothetical protein
MNKAKKAKHEEKKAQMTERENEIMRGKTNSVDSSFGSNDSDTSFSYKTVKTRGSSDVIDLRAESEAHSKRMDEFLEIRKKEATVRELEAENMKAELEIRKAESAAKREFDLKMIDLLQRAFNK